MRAIILATIAAIAIQPFFFALWFLSPPVLAGEVTFDHEIIGMFNAVIVVATAFVLVFGLPIFFVLRHFKRNNWWSLAVAGFLAGAIPIAVFSLPRRSWGDFSWGGNWHGHHVDFIEHGVPTVYGWLSYAQDTIIYGLHGLIGALVFHFVWRRYSHAEEAPRA